jgi:hypothetical protein
MMDIIFNEGPFYPHLFSETEKQSIKHSILWSIAADIHKLSLGELLIAIKLDSEVHDCLTHLYMANKAGKIALTVSYDVVEQEFNINAQRTYLLNRGKDKQTAKSKRIPYLMKTLKKDNAALLKKVMLEASEDMTSQMSDCLKVYTNEFGHIPHYNAPLAGHEEFEALKHVFREGYSQSDESRGMVDRLKKVYESFCVVEKKAEDNNQELRETFSHGVWVVGYMKTQKRMVFGAAHVDKDFKLMPDESVPFRLRPANFEWIPGVDSKTHGALMFALALCKTNRDMLGKPTCVDPEELIPEGDKAYKESGSVCFANTYSSHRYHPQWFIVAR